MTVSVPAATAGWLERGAIETARDNKASAITGRAYVQGNGLCPDKTGRVLVTVLSVVAVPPDHPLASIDTALCAVIGLPTLDATMTLALDHPTPAVDSDGESLRGRGLAGIATSSIWRF